jgi:hypothetical protein
MIDLISMIVPSPSGSMICPSLMILPLSMIGLTRMILLWFTKTDDLPNTNDLPDQHDYTISSQTPMIHSLFPNW